MAMELQKESKEQENRKLELSCPLPISDYKNVLLAHGGGGKLTQQLIQKMFASRFRNEFLDQSHDGAILPLNGTRFAFTTDSYVIKPIFFPGGDIGTLAVNGTVNDLAMCGAKPLYLSVAFVIEEGLSMDELWRVVNSMQRAAEQAGAMLVTGDTKVVDRGKGDKIFITTAGIGTVENGIDINPKNAQAGDTIIVSGNIGVHGIAIMSVREGLEFETKVESDCAPLNGLVHTMFEASRQIHVLRDPTRGGVASALNEIAETSGVGMLIEEEKIPIDDSVSGACEILGFDPLYVANEGKLIAVVSPDDAGKILAAMRSHPLGKNSAIIGSVTSDHPKTVLMKSRIGGTRVVDMLSGEQLPRIC
jgi:hydrogenase expression/formation protein HypE